METTRPTQPAPLNFEAVHEGLGFHPFSDGLPYTPVTKPQHQKVSYSGAGAVSAGRPVFAPIPQLAPAKTAAAAQLATAKPAPTLEKAATDSRNTFGYLARRIWAYLFDTCLNFSIVGAGITAALWRQEVPADIFLSSGILLLAGAFAAFFSWALVTSQEIAFGTSMGKRLFGLSLSASPSAILIRAIFFIPMLLLGGLGLMIGAFNSRKSCGHDLIAGAQPIDVWNEEN